MSWVIGRRIKSLLSLASLTPSPINPNGAETMVSRHFHRSSRSRAVNLRKINPKVPPQEAVSIAESLYNLIKQNGPLSIGATWNLSKEGVVSGLNSKTHMKIMLKWMRGRAMLKQLCHHVGSNKKFLLTTLPEDPDAVVATESVEHKTQPKKNTAKKAKLKLRKKQSKEQKQKQKQNR